MSERRQDGAKVGADADGAGHSGVQAEVRDDDQQARLDRDLAAAREARPPGRPAIWVIKGF